MASCIRCGSTMGDFDAGGDMVCQNCEAAGSGGAGGTPNVPCQRCGMYLPSYELRMWNSRLYCAYCIMDIQDEEKRVKAREGRGAEEIIRALGICERCGRETAALYVVNGRKLCQPCYAADGGGGASSPSMLGQIVQMAAAMLGVRQKPKIIPMPPLEGMRVKSGGAPGNDSARQKGAEKFSVRERRMVEEEEGELGIEPLTEGRTQEKKPAPEARKKFFSQHSEEKK